MNAQQRLMKKLVDAIRSGDAERVRSLASQSSELLAMHDPGSFGATALIHAVMADDRTMVDLLIDVGADIDQRSDWWAGSFGVLDHCSTDMATHLVERGATLTPHAAARLGMTDELRSMVAQDPNCVHARGGDGQLPLHFARTADIADLLLDAGADIEAKDIDHESTAAQWLATSRPEVATHLVARGARADPFLAAVTGDVELLARLVESDPAGADMRLSRGIFFTQGDRAAEHIYFYTIGEGCALLHAAAVADQPDSVRWLLQAGADADARGGYDDQAPLHAAAWHDSAAAVRALIEGGADVNAVSGRIHRNEPIGWAIVSGASEAFSVLLEEGAAVRDAHRDAAEAGASGEFRQFNRERPVERWAEIRDRLASL